MSFRSWLSGQLAMAGVPIQVLLYLDWKAEARRTGQTYEAVANAHVEQWSETLTAWLLSLPYELTVGLIGLAMVVYLYPRVMLLLDVLEGAIYRHGILRVTVAGAIIAMGAMGYVEITSELPQWLQPEALVGTQEVEGL